jgi:hypothetical protein
MSDKQVEVEGQLQVIEEGADVEAMLQQVLAETEAQMAELGKRVVGFEHWTWVAGMRTTDKEMVCSVAQNGILRLYSTADKKVVERDATDCTPNFADPMTVLALIDVIRIAFPERDFVVQFPAMVPFHDLAKNLVDYLEDKPVAPHSEAESE